jgi:3-isopropylmalate dehydrogenase
LRLCAFACLFFVFLRIRGNDDEKIAVLPGDGIGPEVTAEAVKVLERLRRDFGLNIEMETAPAAARPTMPTASAAGGDPGAGAAGRCGAARRGRRPPLRRAARALRPEKGLLGLRAGLGLFANLRPAILYPQLARASSLKPEVVAGLDMLIVRELTGGIYFGEPRGLRTLESGEREGFNTMVYSRARGARASPGWPSTPPASAARKLCSVDKANVLDASSCGARW